MNDSANKNEKSLKKYQEKITLTSKYHRESLTVKPKEYENLKFLGNLFETLPCLRIINMRFK